MRLRLNSISHNLHSATKLSAAKQELPLSGGKITDFMVPKASEPFSSVSGNVHRRPESLENQPTARTRKEIEHSQRISKQSLCFILVDSVPCGMRINE